MVISRSDIINIVRDRFDVDKADRAFDICITGSTRLVADLGFSSIEFVVIFEKIQQILSDRINFIDLIMPDRSSYVDDLSIDQIADFLLSGGSNSEQPAGILDPYSDRREPISQYDVDLLNRSIQHQDYLDEQVTTTTQLCFLLSAPRSGSTLLRRMLGCHPDVYAPMELHLMSYQDFSQRNQELSDEDYAHLLEGTIVARQEIRGMTHAVSMAIDQMYARDRRPVSQFFIELDPYFKTQVFVDKTPTYAFSLSTLERIKKVFPGAKFIHLTRRPNAVIKSIIDSDLGQIIRFMQTSGIHPNRFAEALWCLCEQNIRAALKDVGPRAIRVDYESLVTMPEQTMGRLHDFLDIPSSLSFNPYTQQYNTSKEQVDCFAGDLKNYLRNTIDSSVASEWEPFRSLNWLSDPTSALLQNG